MIIKTPLQMVRQNVLKGISLSQKSKYHSEKNAINKCPHCEPIFYNFIFITVIPVYHKAFSQYDFPCMNIVPIGPRVINFTTRYLAESL